MSEETCDYIIIGAGTWMTGEKAAGMIAAAA